MQFTKLFSSILDSTIWREPPETRLVWITMLAMADRNGEVHSSIPGLADRAKVSLDECLSALKCLKSPDKYSRTQDHEGRRIADIDGGWALLNHAKYRALLSAEERKEYNRRKQAEYRAKRKKMSNNVNDCRTQSAKSTHTEAEADAKADKKKSPKPPEGDSLPFNSDEFTLWWSAWKDHRKEIKKPLKPSMIKAQLKQFEEWGEHRSIEAMRYTIRQGWQGLREPEETKKPKSGFKSDDLTL